MTKRKQGKRTTQTGNATASNGQKLGVGANINRTLSAPGGTGVGNGTLISYTYDEGPSLRDEVDAFLTSLQSAVLASQTVYDTNIQTLCNHNFDDDSPVMTALEEWIDDHAGSLDCDSTYDEVIVDIESYREFYDI